MVFGADFALQDYLPPDTKVVMGLRVRALTESSLFQETGTQQRKTLTESWTKLTAVTGFDPLRDIDEVLLTSPADRENAPALVVLRGRFNLDRLGAGAELYHGVAIQGGGKKGSGVLALLDATTALAGEAPVVKAAIDRRGQPVAYDGALVARVASLRERFDLWGTGERPQGFVAPGGQNEQLGSDRPVRVRHTDHPRAGVGRGGARAVAEGRGETGGLARDVTDDGEGAVQRRKVRRDAGRLHAETQLRDVRRRTSEGDRGATVDSRAQATSSQPKVTGETPSAVPAVRQTTTPAGTSVFTLPGKALGREGGEVGSTSLDRQPQKLYMHVVWDGRQLAKSREKRSLTCPAHVRTCAGSPGSYPDL